MNETHGRKIDIKFFFVFQHIMLEIENSALQYNLHLWHHLYSSFLVFYARKDVMINKKKNKTLLVVLLIQVILIAS